MLQPNPRGSYGQGEAFTQANRKDFGYGDLRDILAGVDAVVAKYPVDPQRVGITGWSYGGFMTMFAVTQTQRFKAAVAGAGLSDWQSYYGENSIDQWMIPYFGASVYDDPAVYAKSSAINFIKQAQTPTLVVVGDRDGECPGAAVVRVLARPARRACADATGRVSQRRTRVCESRPSARCDGPGRGVVCQVHAGGLTKPARAPIERFARHPRTAESIEYKAIRPGRDRAGGHPVLIHFSLEQIERVLSTGCMEWTNADGR